MTGKQAINSVGTCAGQAVTCLNPAFPLRRSGHRRHVPGRCSAHQRGQQPEQHEGVARAALLLACKHHKLPQPRVARCKLRLPLVHRPHHTQQAEEGTATNGLLLLVFALPLLLLLLTVLLLRRRRPAQEGAWQAMRRPVRERGERGGDERQRGGSSWS